jgi:hypothetical protein
MGRLPTPAPPVALPMLAELLAPHENESGFFSSSFILALWHSRRPDPSKF